MIILQYTQFTKVLHDKKQRELKTYGHGVGQCGHGIEQRPKWYFKESAIQTRKTHRIENHLYYEWTLMWDCLKTPKESLKNQKGNNEFSSLKFPWNIY